MASLQKRADEIYLAMQHDCVHVSLYTKFDDVISAKTRLTRQLLEWREPSMKLNLLQLAVAYDRSDIAALLVSKFDGFLYDQGLYKPLGPPTNAGKATADSVITYNSPLHLACWFGREDIVEILLSHNLDPLSSQGYVTIAPRPRWSVDSQQRSGRVENLLDNVDLPKATPLELALRGGRGRCAEVVLNHRINRLKHHVERSNEGVYQAIVLQECNDFLNAPLLHKVCFAGTAREAEQLLLVFPWEAFIQFKQMLPFQTAIRCGNASCLKALLNQMFPSQANFTHGDLEKCLWVLGRCRFFGNVAQMIEILIDYGFYHLANPKKGSFFPLMEAVCNLSKWSLLSRRTPKSRLCLWGRLLRRKVVSHGADAEVVSSYFRQALAGVRWVDAALEIQHYGTTCFDSVLAVCREFDCHLIDVLQELLKRGFDPCQWKTHADLRHLQAFLLKPRGEAASLIKLHLLNLLCLHGWNLDCLIPASCIDQELFPPVVWLATCCTASCCSHRACDLWRSEFVDSAAFHLILNSMKLSTLRTAAEILSLFVGGGWQNDLAAYKALEKICQIMTTPRSLQHTCKLYLRTSIGRRYEEFVGLNDLPWTVRNYVIEANF